MNEHEQVQEHEQQRIQMPMSAKVGIGCGIGCLIIIILAILAGVGGYFFIKNKIDQMENELKAKGFEEVIEGQMLQVSDRVEGLKLYKGQVVQLTGDTATNVAILAQYAEIHGRVNGRVYFRGQILAIMPEAVIEHGLDVKAQVIQNAGTVNGEITGAYQAIETDVTPVNIQMQTDEVMGDE